MIIRPWTISTREPERALHLRGAHDYRGDPLLSAGQQTSSASAAACGIPPEALQARDRLQYALGREATVDEIAQEMHLPVEDVVFALEAIQDPVSLSPFITIRTFIHYGPGEDENTKDENWLEEISIKDALQHLNEREKKILRLRFFEGRTQMEVAGEIGISQAQVSLWRKRPSLHNHKHVQVQ